MRPPAGHLLTIEEVLQAEELGTDLPLDGVRVRAMGHGTGPTPEHLALAQADGIQVLALQLQDESAVQHVQQLVGVVALLVAGDVLRTGEAHLL